MLQQQRSEAHLKFEKDVSEIEREITNRLQSYENLLFAARGLFDVTGDDMTPEKFKEFAVSLSLQDRYPGLESLNFAERVDLLHAEAFEKKIGRRIFPESQNRFGDVFAYAYPNGRTGLNWATSARAQSSIYPVLRQSGRVIASLRPYPKKEGDGLALGARLGYYAPGMQTYTAQERDVAYRGSLGIGFLVKPFFVAAIGQAKLSQFHVEVHRIFSADNPGNREEWNEKNLLFSSDSVAGSYIKNRDGEIFAKRVRIDFGQSAMEIGISTDINNYLFGPARYAASIIAVLVFGFFLIAASYLIWTFIHRRKLEQLVSIRTEETYKEAARREKIEREIIHVVENERRIIGQELHDDLGQDLTAVRFASEYLSKRLYQSAPKEAEEFSRINETLGKIAQRLRVLAKGLFPISMEVHGLPEALRELASATEENYAVRCVVTGDEINLDDSDISINLYRIAQEAIANAIKHGRAKNIAITLHHSGGHFSMSIVDDGIGIRKAEGAERGMGMNTISYRAKLIGMLFKISSHSPHGTSIEISSPKTNDNIQ
ncbi:MAG: CHASE domain-containing protein [Burkholderiales bacterium]|nr:CHASE domain-containing protein [Burkholderiales bacterium]